YFDDPNKICILCGHCIAICPTDAIEYDAEEKAREFESVNQPSSLIDYETQLKFLQTRRSIRRYKNKDVSDKDIESILETMKYAPSASNARSWRYIIIRDQDKINKIRKAVIKMLSLLRTIVKYKWILKYLAPKSVRRMIEDPTTIPKLDNFLSSYEKGEDPVFHNAPVVIILYSPSYGSMAGVDSGIALTHGILAAQSLGLGTCWIGYAQEALNRYDKNKEWLGIPEAMRISGVIVVGHPDIKFSRIPPRDSLKVRYF
ncbi:MAG: nitroreductase family protein, partial [Candidatus Lokiarchaeota archaeon]